MVKFNKPALPNCIKECRAGRIYIKHQFMEDYPHIVLGVMARIIVVRAEEHFMTKSVHYEAYSPEFDSLGDDGHMCGSAPEYDIHVNASGSNLLEFSIRFIRIGTEIDEPIRPLRTITFGDSNENADFAHDPIMFNTHDRLR